jgi:hypothetical protein
MKHPPALPVHLLALELEFTERATTGGTDKLSRSCSERSRHQVQW